MAQATDPVMVEDVLKTGTGTSLVEVMTPLYRQTLIAFQRSRRTPGMLLLQVWDYLHMDSYVAQALAHFSVS